MKAIKFKAEYKKSVNHPGPIKVYVDDRLLGRDNKYPSLIDIMKQNKDLSYEQVLVKENLTAPKLVIDRSVFVSQKESLKQAKRDYNKSSRAGKLTTEISDMFIRIGMKHLPNFGSFKFTVN